MSSKTETNELHTGKIFFIGSGPGNPDLITVKGATLLSQAEVIITDRLAGDEIIERYANPNAIVIDVGKQGGNKKSYKQKDINKLLVQFAGLYEKVVRLKGGDIAFFQMFMMNCKRLQTIILLTKLFPALQLHQALQHIQACRLRQEVYASGVQLLTYYNNTVISDETLETPCCF